MQPTLVPHALAALLGQRLARVDERYRRMSQALLALLGARAVAEGSRLFRPDKDERLAAYAAGLQPPPYTGIARASWAVEQIAVLAWYAVLAWAVWRALKDEAPGHPDSNRSPTRRESGSAWRALFQGAPSASHCGHVDRARGIIVALASLASAAALFAAYPLVRGRCVEVAATVVFCAALTVQLAAATRFVLHWRHTTVAQDVALVLVVGSVADAAGPFLFASPARSWQAGEPVGVLIWSVTIGVELWGLARKRAR